jgi:flagellar motor switch protein FliG
MAILQENLRKAAVLLLSLPKEQAQRLLGKLEPQQAATVVSEMDGLGEVVAVEQEAVAREFAEAGTARPGNRRPKQAAPFRFLHNLQDDALLRLIADEHPQTIALILSCLPPHQAAEVLAGLTPAQQFSIVCRIATMSTASPEVVRDVEKGLKLRFDGAHGRSTGNGGVASVVKILNVMEPAVERRLLEKLTDADPQLVRDIRRAMFGADVAACEEWNVTGAAC